MVSAFLEKVETGETRLELLKDGERVYPLHHLKTVFLPEPVLFRKPLLSSHARHATLSLSCFPSSL